MEAWDQGRRVKRAVKGRLVIGGMERLRECTYGWRSATKQVHLVYQDGMKKNAKKKLYLGLTAQ